MGFDDETREGSHAPDDTAGGRLKQSGPVSDFSMKGRRGVPQLLSRTHAAILTEAMGMALVGGLKALSIEAIASRLGISVGTVFARFANTEALQLATLDAVIAVFVEAKVRPALSRSNPAERLGDLCAGWFDHLECRGPAGCILYATAEEYRCHPGFIRDRVNYHRQSWLKLIDAIATEAQSRSNLNDAFDVEQLTFEITAFQEAGHSAAIVGDQAGFQRARNSCRDRIRALQTTGR